MLIMPVRKYVDLVVHTVISGLYIHAESMRLVVPGASDTYGGDVKFLTVLNLFLSIGYFTVAVLIDLKSVIKDDSDTEKTSASFRKLRDYVFFSILFPVSAAVPLLYWGIFAINSELIAPMERRKYVPIHGFYNHAVHTAPIVVVLLECVVTFHKPCSNFLKGCMGWILFASAYLTWILWIAYYAGVWAYPFLKEMSALHRLFFFIGSFLLGGSLHKTALLIHGWWWKGEILKLKTF